MSFNYDVTTPAGKVRLLISDIGGSDGKSFLFEDAEINSFLSLAVEENVKLAASMALRTIAANEAQVSKRITFLELSTDGAKVAESLLKLAEKYESEADEDFDVEIAHMSYEECRGGPPYEGVET